MDEEPRDLKDRLAIVLVDGQSWIEVWPAGGYFCVELHNPRREGSVGYVDNPADHVGVLEEGVRELLTDPRAAGKVLETLAARGVGKKAAA